MLLQNVNLKAVFSIVKIPQYRYEIWFNDQYNPGNEWFTRTNYHRFDIYQCILTNWIVDGSSTFCFTYILDHVYFRFRVGIHHQDQICSLIPGHDFVDCHNGNVDACSHWGMNKMVYVFAYHILEFSNVCSRRSS